MRIVREPSQALNSTAYTSAPRGHRLRVVLPVVILLLCSVAVAQMPTPPRPPDPLAEWFKKEPGSELALTLRLVFSLAALSLLPAALVTMTSFLRIIIVLSFLRSALGTQQTPPNLVLIGLALFLTLFIMQPVWQEVDRRAVQPYLKGELTYSQAVTKAAGPVRGFMIKQARERDILLFIRMGRLPRPSGPDEVPMRVLLPAFAISELKSAFQLGFVIYVPFIVIDLVVAGALMSMGMMMLPPVTISLPLKILLFVMIDGWHILARSLVLSFS